MTAPTCNGKDAVCDNLDIPLGQGGCDVVPCAASRTPPLMSLSYCAGLYYPSQEDIFILHFKKVHQNRMKECWDLLKTDSRLPTAELGEQVDTMYKHGVVNAKSHGIEPARKYFGRHSEVR